MAMKTLSMNVENAGRVDSVVKQLSGVSHSQVRGLFDHDCVSVNSLVCEDPAITVSRGDLVALSFDPTQRYKEKKRPRVDRTFKINFEDDHFIVVEKLAGSLTVPTDRGESNTLVQRVSLYLNHAPKKSSAFVVHRLDREVSGLLVFGKSKRIADRLIEQFRAHKPERNYLAIVAGQLPNDHGTMRSHLATAKNLDRYVARESSETEMAITHYQVTRRMPDATVVQVTLETGKRNQIRVHFADAGHPVLGDSRYQPELAQHLRWPWKRIALHAMTLGFEHPVTGQAVKFESPVPAELQKFISNNR